MSATAANVHDVTETHNLLHGGETVVWGDAGHPVLLQIQDFRQGRLQQYPFLGRQVTDEHRVLRRFAKSVHLPVGPGQPLGVGDIVAHEKSVTHIYLVLNTG